MKSKWIPSRAAGRDGVFVVSLMGLGGDSRRWRDEAAASGNPAFLVPVVLLRVVASASGDALEAGGGMTGNDDCM